MIRSIVFLCFLAFFEISALAQAKIEFRQTKHNFGEIEEEGGPVKHTFVFENTGNDTLRIENVRASCGCTTPAWTKQDVMPGDTGYIIAEYNPFNRPGGFNKSLTVNSNADKQVTTLQISGRVKPKPKGPADDFPTAMGDLRVKFRALPLGNITNQGVVTKEFEIFNQGDEKMVFDPNQVTTPDHINLVFEPAVLNTEKRGKLIVYYDTKKKDDLGYFTEPVSFVTSEKTDSLKTLYVTAFIKEYFPPMTDAELAKAPKISISDRSHNLGTIKEGDVAESEFSISNFGKETLHIRKLLANCSCIEVTAEKDKLKPGQSTTIKVVFNSDGRVGYQTKNITIFSNDPVKSTVQVTVKAKIDN
ncbi:DUF1573 domain-containing protein [Marinigracilibium pacificum]|uniref:DUF1573 domain-containing protein n=1 Tax=Marinigracilibium pacificum TaxID=2729599 RepID=A0A848J041_9BACT|nr:DUF1573 domain-containing protein [Marinigracilibium pacificum]NMM49216.1 DUF1573 domain-containing protein [Marinigracilibium pacificum]